MSINSATYPATFKTDDCSNCGKAYEWTVMNGRSVYAKEVQPTFKRGLALLHFYDLHTDVWLIVESIFLIDKDTGAVDMDKQYYYHEHTCPTNYLGVKAIVADGDFDPHGVFLYVRGVTYEEICKNLNISKAELLDPNNKHLEKVFPEAVRGDDSYFDFPDETADAAMRLAFVPPKDKQH